MAASTVEESEVMWKHALGSMILVAATAFAQSSPPASTLPKDEKIDLVAADLRAISRIATLSKNVSDSRQVMLAMIDSDVENLREPRSDGSFRWASLQREEASRVKDQKAIE